MMRVRWNLFLALGLLALTLTACAAGGNGGAEADEPARPNVSQEVSPEEGGRELRSGGYRERGGGVGGAVSAQ